MIDKNEPENTAPLCDSEENETQTDEREEATVIAAFRGEITGDAALFVKQHIRRLNLAVYGVATAVAFFVFLAVLLLADPALWFLSLLVLPLPLLGFLPISENGFRAFPHDITVTAQEVVVKREMTGRIVHRDIADAREMVDMGDFYVIKYPYAAWYVCDKSCLVEGDAALMKGLFVEKKGSETDDQK